MIFCAITQTPCIVIDNSNRKVSSLYETWLQNLDYIKLIKKIDLNKFKENLEILEKMDLANLEAIDYTEQFTPLINECIN